MAAPNRLEGETLFAHPIADAVFEVIHERGYQLADCDAFITRAGMNPTEFYRQFSGKEDVTLRVFEATIDDFERRVRVAYASAAAWPATLRAAAWEVARWILGHPDHTWFGMVGVLEAGDMALVRREEVFKWCAELVDAGRSVAPDPAAVPRAAPLLAIGAIVETLRRHEEGTLIGDTIETVPKMMYAAVRPYLGEEVARRELEIPPPPDLDRRS